MKPVSRCAAGRSPALTRAAAITQEGFGAVGLAPAVAGLAEARSESHAFLSGRDAESPVHG